ncbi:hypothetical protein LOAG_16902 [Loa loa]|uniref:Retrovirus-related Pol polyprotein from transposon TNT 1-94 n=1 Tax=Loa loa TaxID=7209 RepID=A0A1I7V950_LOALO|nr:hypothetical protein LOAG_16902 [Loa loa]EJD76068.1 hypothetical protein LOAG_16902 [Loa loa]
MFLFLCTSFSDKNLECSGAKTTFCSIYFRHGIKVFQKAIHIQSEAHDIDLSSVSQTSLPIFLFSSANSTTWLKNVRSLSDLNRTYRLDFSVVNIRDTNSYKTQLAG